MSRLSISNIAWPADADDEAVALAGRLGFEGIELAPAKVFGPLQACPGARILEYRQHLIDQGLEIPALQAILFGVAECELFRSDATRTRLAAHLRRIAETAGVLGAKACVFGAPTLRDPGDLEPEVAFDIAVEFFSAIAPSFEASGSTLAFEANPAHYKCRFMTDTRQAIRLVETVGRPGFRLQIDTGTVFINGEDPSVVTDAIPLASHFHASEMDLAPLGSLGSDHGAIAAALKRGSYRGWLSVEMRSQAKWKDHLGSAMDLMRSLYHA